MRLGIASVALTGMCAAALVTGAPPVSAAAIHVTGSVAGAAHRDPCKKRQVHVYYANPTHLLDSGKVHGSGHGAKLRYTREGDIEKLTYKALKHHRLKEVRVVLYNINTGKNKAKRLKTSSHSYSYGDTAGYISYFDICASKG